MASASKDVRHNNKMAGRYVDAFTWHEDIEAFVQEHVKESPLLHVCCGPVSDFGDVRVDRYVKPIPPAVMADWAALPFATNSFAAVFADPPWSAGYKRACAEFCKEALRVAPVAYVMSPWLWVNRDTTRTVWVREFPGVNNPILFARYERHGKLI